MSALPKAVQKQIAEANKIADNIKKGLAPDGAAPPGAPPPNDAPPPIPPPPAPAAAAAPPAPPAPIVTPAGAPPPDESWEKKYRVLKGKYDAEVPRLIEQTRSQGVLIQTLQGQLTVTQGMISQLNQNRASAPATPGGAPATGKKLVTDDEVKQFGPDLYDFIQRAAREVSPQGASQTPQPVAQQVAQIAQSVQTLSAKAEQTDKQRFEEYLTQHVPNWVEQNGDEAFIVWLDEEDPYTGRKRQELLDQAAQRFDGPRVAALFKGFQKENAALASPPNSAAAPAAPAPAAAPPSATPALERLVAPGQPKAGPASAPNEAQKRIYTRAEIDDFNRRRMGYVTKGRKVPDSLVQEERAILAAANEGRISG